MWDESKMNVTDRILCNILKKSISRIDSAHCELWMESLRSALGQKRDWTDKTYLTALVNYI